jgi:hypothetical protein
MLIGDHILILESTKRVRLPETGSDGTSHLHSKSGIYFLVVAPTHYY